MLHLDSFPILPLEMRMARPVEALTQIPQAAAIEEESAPVSEAACSSNMARVGIIICIIAANLIALTAGSAVVMKEAIDMHQSAMQTAIRQ